MTSPILRVEQVSKRFGNVTALRDVTMSVPAGEVTCLLGDNGAGKSTLIQILAGVHRPSTGRYLVDGEPVGAINRVPQAGETRSNMHVGGRPEKIGLSDRDLEICARIGPLLREKGQVFVGIDVIGDWLTEINVTSPTGIQELERFDGINAAAKIWEAIERRRAG